MGGLWSVDDSRFQFYIALSVVGIFGWHGGIAIKITIHICNGNVCGGHHCALVIFCSTNKMHIWNVELA